MAAGPSKSSGFIYQAYDKVADSLGSGLKTLADLAQPITHDAAEAAKNPSTQNQSSDYVVAATPSAPKFDTSRERGTVFSGASSAVYTSNHVAEGQIADHRGHEDAASLIFNGIHNFATETDASHHKGIDGLFWGAVTVCAVLVGIPAISLISDKIQSFRNNQGKGFYRKKYLRTF